MSANVPCRTYSAGRPPRFARSARNVRDLGRRYRPQRADLHETKQNAMKVFQSSGLQPCHTCLRMCVPAPPPRGGPGVGPNDMVMILWAA